MSSLYVYRSMKRNGKTIYQIVPQNPRNVDEAHADLVDLVIMGQTTKFLEKCRVAGYKRIAISVRDEECQEWWDWEYVNRVFGVPCIMRCGNLNPGPKSMIAVICEEMGINEPEPLSGYAGAQAIKSDSLMPGIYVLRNGKWQRKRID